MESRGSSKLEKGGRRRNREMTTKGGKKDFGAAAGFEGGGREPRNAGAGGL